jgi:AcrR family transcriptional regulator
MWYNGVNKMQKRKDTLIRQKEIVSAARKLIVKYGSEHVTVKKIAKEIGVSEGAIYRHFKSKREVLSFLVDDIESTLIEDIDNSYVSGINSLEQLSSIILNHISSIEQRSGITFQVIAEIISLGDKKLNKKIYEVINKYIVKIQGILAEGINTELLRSDLDTEAAAKLFFSMTQGMVNIWALSQYNFNLQEQFKPIWEIFINAIVLPASISRLQPQPIKT